MPLGRNKLASREELVEEEKVKEKGGGVVAASVLRKH